MQLSKGQPQLQLHFCSSPRKKNANSRFICISFLHLITISAKAWRTGHNRLAFPTLARQSGGFCYFLPAKSRHHAVGKEESMQKKEYPSHKGIQKSKTPATKEYKKSKTHVCMITSGHGKP